MQAGKWKNNLQITTAVKILALFPPWEKAIEAEKNFCSSRPP